ncbi:MAG: nitrogenase [Deltaproteobacteria bacterium]|jgi:nitrogenase molybdenum-iron protein alpha chain|nr:nitrogenase [Deltaproteobacteria bacterium]
MTLEQKHHESATVGQEVIIRERRLGALLTFQGKGSDLMKLAKENPEGCCHDNYFNQCGDCSSQRAMLPISQIRDAALVNHAPIGCASDLGQFNAQHRRGLRYNAIPVQNIRALSSNLTEKDLIMGGENKLAAALEEAYRRFAPKAIFVTTSCASGIIGDDIEEVTLNAEEKLGIPIVPIYCEGFKSMVWTTGFDAAYHGIVRKLVKPPRERRNDIINIMNFSNQHAFSPLLAKIGMEARYLVHQASVEELAHISEAAATGHMCETLGTYIAASLEKLYGVPELKSPPPYGSLWTDLWLREIGKITGREKLVEKVIVSERKRIAPELEAVRKKLEGRTVFAFGGASFCHNMLALAHDLGLKIVGMMGFHHDMTFDNDYEEIISLKNTLTLVGNIGSYSVCNKQPYQMIKILQDIKPDLVMSRHESLPTQAVKLGIPTFFAADANILGGYDGVVTTGKRILGAIKSRNFVKNLSAHSREPHSAWWKKQKDPFYFAKGKRL